MINQYHSDMHEIERLDKLLDQCKTTGCTQSDVAALGIDHAHITGGQPDGSDSGSGSTVPLTEDDKKYLGGKINFPDCGANVSADCFWLHYKKSGWLDFLSFFGYIPGLIGCAVFDEYEYGLCLANFAYILVDAYAKKAAPPNYFSVSV